MSSKLEEKTKIYGVSFIFTGELYEYMSKEAREYARIIDIIENEGMEDTRLFTIDIDSSHLQYDLEEDQNKNEEEESNSDMMNKLKKVNYLNLNLNLIL